MRDTPADGDVAGDVVPLDLVAGRSLGEPGHVFDEGALTGLALAARRSWWWLLLVGAAAIAAAWFYTGGPRPYGYAGPG